MAGTGHNILAKPQPKPMGWLSAVGTVYNRDEERESKDDEVLLPMWLELEIWFELRFFLGLLLLLLTPQGRLLFRELHAPTELPYTKALERERKRGKKHITNNKSACAIEEQVCCSTCIIKDQLEISGNSYDLILQQQQHTLWVGEMGLWGD